MKHNLTNLEIYEIMDIVNEIAFNAFSTGYHQALYSSYKLEDDEKMKKNYDEAKKEYIHKLRLHLQNI